jgi:hypothetical protein
MADNADRLGKNLGDIVEPSDDQVKQLDELVGPGMTQDEMKFWAECYTIAMKNVMFHLKRNYEGGGSETLPETIARACKQFADRALAMYREKKLDVRR